jgi:hypothetical protein
VETGVRNIFFINGSYSHRAGRNKPIFANFCLIQSDNFRKFETRVDVVPRRGPDRLLLGDQVALGSAEFDRNVIVTCEDPAAARNTINPAMQKVLLEQVIQPLVNPAWIVFYKGYAVLILGSYIEPACWLDSVNLAKKLDEAAEE